MTFVARTLQVVGALSIAIITGVCSYIAYSVATNSDQVDKASSKDVAFVFNRSGLSTTQEFKVLSSFESVRSGTGDHLDRYCIQLSEFKIADPQEKDWSAFSSLDVTAQGVVSEALVAGEAEQCFIGKAIDPAELKTYVWSITIHRRIANAYDVILFDPTTKRLLYVGYKS